MIRAVTNRADTEARIVDAAARLLAERGSAAITTRGVAEAAGVQPPAIYRLFGDKGGLLEAVAEHVMATYVATKTETVQAAATENVDPLEDLRDGWRTQMDFGLANPTLFRLLSDPERGLHSPAAQSGLRVLEARVHRVAESGRLGVSEQRAVGLIHAAGTGAIQTLLATPVGQRDPDLADTLFEAVLRQILIDGPASPENPPSSAAVALRAVAPELEMLTASEQQLLCEWLDRIVGSRSRDLG